MGHSLKVSPAVCSNNEWKLILKCSKSKYDMLWYHIEIITFVSKAKGNYRYVISKTLGTFICEVFMAQCVTKVHDLWSNTRLPHSDNIFHSDCI